MYIDFFLWGCYYIYINKFKEDNFMTIINHKEYVLNTTSGLLIENKTGITYLVSKPSLSDLINDSKPYRKLMMEGKITRK